MTLRDQIAVDPLSPRSIEALSGLLTMLFAVWALAFDWFTLYRSALAPYADWQTAVCLVVFWFGLFGFAAAYRQWHVTRMCMTCIHIVLYSGLLTLAVQAGGPSGVHAPTFGFLVVTHIWVWVRLDQLGRWVDR